MLWLVGLTLRKRMDERKHAWHPGNTVAQRAKLYKLSFNLCLHLHWLLFVDPWFNFTAVSSTHYTIQFSDVFYGCKEMWKISHLHWNSLIPVFCALVLWSHASVYTDRNLGIFPEGGQCKCMTVLLQVRTLTNYSLSWNVVHNSYSLRHIHTF